MHGGELLYLWIFSIFWRDKQFLAVCDAVFHVNLHHPRIYGIKWWIYGNGGLRVLIKTIWRYKLPSICYWQNGGFSFIEFAEWSKSDLPPSFNFLGKTDPPFPSSIKSAWWILFQKRTGDSEWKKQNKTKTWSFDFEFWLLPSHLFLCCHYKCVYC